MSPETHKKISKLMSLILRHEPEKWGLTLDAEGFVPLPSLLTAMQKRNRGASEAQIRQVVRESDKQRFEIVDAEPQNPTQSTLGAKIRARYGHSIQSAVSYEPIAPPEILYHGTARRSIEAIRAEGLRSMNRQYVHLSSEAEQARLVGRRHDGQPIILTIRAGDAHRAGVRFYNPEPRLYLADEIGPEWIEE